MTKGDADLRWFRIQTFLLGIGRRALHRARTSWASR